MTDQKETELQKKEKETELQNAELKESELEEISAGRKRRRRRHL